MRRTSEWGALLNWWDTPVDCTSAIARLKHDGRLTAAEVTETLRRLRMLATSWDEFDPVEAIRENAEPLLRAHLLRAADALCLAAAQREGYSLIDPLGAVAPPRGPPDPTSDLPWHPDGTH